MRLLAFILTIFVCQGCRTLADQGKKTSNLASISIGVIDQSKIAFDSGILYLNEKEVPFSKSDIQIDQLVSPGRYQISMTLKKGADVVASTTLSPCSKSQVELKPGPNDRVSVDVCTKVGLTIPTPILNSELGVDIKIRTGLPFKKGFVCYKPKKLEVMSYKFRLEPIIVDEFNFGEFDALTQIRNFSYNDMDKIYSVHVATDPIYRENNVTPEVLSGEGTLSFQFIQQNGLLNVLVSSKDATGKPIIFANKKIAAETLSQIYTAGKIGEFKDFEGTNLKGLIIEALTFSDCVFDPQ